MALGPPVGDRAPENDQNKNGIPDMIDEIFIDTDGDGDNDGIPDGIDRDPKVRDTGDDDEDPWKPDPKCVGSLQAAESCA